MLYLCGWRLILWYDEAITGLWLHNYMIDLLQGEKGIGIIYNIFNLSMIKLWQKPWSLSKIISRMLKQPFAIYFLLRTCNLLPHGNSTNLCANTRIPLTSNLFISMLLGVAKWAQIQTTMFREKGELASNLLEMNAKALFLCWVEVFLPPSEGRHANCFCHSL